MTASCSWVWRPAAGRCRSARLLYLIYARFQPNLLDRPVGETLKSFQARYPDEYSLLLLVCRWPEYVSTKLRGWTLDNTHGRTGTVGRGYTRSILAWGGLSDAIRAPHSPLVHAGGVVLNPAECLTVVDQFAPRSCNLGSGNMYTADQTSPARVVVDLDPDLLVSKIIFMLVTGSFVKLRNPDPI
jgi:hypothetical protein